MGDVVVYYPGDFGSKEFDPLGFAAFTVSGMIIEKGHGVIQNGIGAAVPVPIKVLYSTAIGILYYGSAKTISGDETDNSVALFSLGASAVATLVGGPWAGVATAVAIELLMKIPPSAADGISMYAAEGSFGLEFQSGATTEEPTKCFPAHTRIQTSRTTSTAISALRVGDVVLAFDARADKGRGALVPRRVTRLYRNATTDWIRLRWVDGTAREVPTCSAQNGPSARFPRTSLCCI